MARFSAMINQFNGGYMSQRMNARTNLENWPTYLKDSCNFIPTVWGGNKFRNGTKFVAETQKSHFIPFIFNNSIAYVVEFCDGFCRFYRDGAPVLTDEGDPLIINSPYSYDSITGSNGECLIKKQQSADVMYLASGDLPLYKLKRISENKFLFEKVLFSKGPFEDKIFINPVELSFVKEGEKNAVLSFTGEYNTTDYLVYNSGNFTNSFNDVVLWGASAYGYVDLYQYVSLYQIENGVSTLKEKKEIFKDTFRITAAPGLTTRGYNAYELAFQYLSNNSFGIYGEKNPNNPEEIYIVATESGNSEWQGKGVKLVVSSFVDAFNGKEFTFEGNFEGYFSSEQPVKNVFSTDYKDRTIRLFINTEDIKSWAGEETYEINQIVKSDGKYYICVTSGTSGTEKPVHSNGIVSDGGVNWKFVNFGYIDGTVSEVVSESEIKIYFDQYELYEWYSQYKFDSFQIGLLGGFSNNFATSVFFFKERLGITINTKNLPKIAFSQTGDYENFDPLVEGEVVDESAILSDLVVGEVDVVNWGVGLDDVLLATESNFLLVSPATTAENFSPTNIKIDYISSNGAGKIAPVVYGDAVVYLDEKNTSLFTNGYYWESDGYKTAKISWTAEDLFEGGIKGITYQKDPDSCFWILTQSGDLISLVYEQTQNVSAFGFHATDGEVQTICCIPSSDGKREELWLNVKRVLPDGTVKYFVEVMQDNSYRNSIWAANRKYVSTENYELAKDNIKKTFWYVDCGVKKESENLFSEIDGLGHLEGKTLVGLADGRYVNDLVVKDGKIDLGTECNYAIVGLPYEGYFVPNSINAGAQAGASQGKVQRVHSATIRVFRSRDFKCGDGVRMKDVIVSRNGVAGEGVLTGDVRIAFPGTYSNRYSEDTSAEIVIKQDKPYPLCVNGLILDMETYDA